MNASEILLKSFDEQLTIEEQQFLNEALEHNASLRTEQADLIRMRSFFQNYEAPQNENFETAVLDKLPDFSAKRISLARWFPRVAAASIIALAISMGQIYMDSGSITGDAILGLEDITSDEAYSYIEMNDIAYE